MAAADGGEGEGGRPIYRLREGRIRVRGFLGDRLGRGNETSGGTRVPRQPAAAGASVRRGGHAGSQRRRRNRVEVLKGDAWRRWRCQTGAGMASRGGETAAAAALCKTSELEVGEEDGDLFVKDEKFRGLTVN